MSSMKLTMHVSKSTCDSFAAAAERDEDEGAEGGVGFVGDRLAGRLGDRVDPLAGGAPNWLLDFVCEPDRVGGLANGFISAGGAKLVLSFKDQDP